MNVDADSKLFAIDTVTDTLIQACCRKGMKYQICSLNEQKALLFGSKKSRKGTSRTIFAHLTYLSGSFKRREGFQHCKLLMRSQNSTLFQIEVTFRSSVLILVYTIHGLYLMYETNNKFYWPFTQRVFK